MPGQSNLSINTNPVLALGPSGQFHILRDSFTKVTVPYEVVQEMQAGGRTQIARKEFCAAAWLDGALAMAEGAPPVAIDEAVLYLSQVRHPTRPRPGARHSLFQTIPKGG